LSERFVKSKLQPLYNSIYIKNNRNFSDLNSEKIKENCIECFENLLFEKS